MAVFTSKVAGGNWSASGQTTWNEVGVPGNGDTVTINGPVVVDVNTTVGTSPASGVNVVTYAATSASKVTIAAGVTWTVKGGIQLAGVADAAINDKLVINAGAKLNFLIPAATNYAIASSSQNYERNRIRIAGVAGVRGEITKDATSGAGAFWSITDGGQLHTTHLNWSFAKITGAGDASNIGVTVNHYERSGVGPEQTLSRVEFNTCGSFFQDWAGWGGNSIIAWTGVTWKNTQGSVTLDGYGTSVALQQTYTGCVFDQTPNAIWAQGSVWTDCHFKEGFGIQGSSPPLSFLRCVFWEALGDQLYQILGFGTTVTDSIFVNTWASSSDSHGSGIQYDPAIAGTTITVDGCTFEMYTAIGGQGNCILTPGATVTDVFDILLKRNIVLPNPADGYSYGDFVHHYSDGATGGPRVTLLHNTIQAAGDGGTAVDVVYSGGVRVLLNKSNIYWDSVAGRARVQYNSNFLTGLNGDTMLSGGAATNYNGCFQLAADRYSTASVFTYSVAPGANDVTSDPQFFDKARNLAKWYRSITTTTGADRTDAEAALAAMRNRNEDSGYNVAFTPLAYLTYVREGFTPTNAAYRTSAHDGTTIGAVQFAAPPVRNVAVSSLAAAAMLAWAPLAPAPQAPARIASLIPAVAAPTKSPGDTARATTTGNVVNASWLASLSAPLPRATTIAATIPPPVVSSTIPVGPLTALEMATVRAAWPDPIDGGVQRRALVAPLTLVYGQQPPTTAGISVAEMALIRSQWPELGEPRLAQAPQKSAAWNVPASVPGDPPPVTAGLTVAEMALLTSSWAPGPPLPPRTPPVAAIIPPPIVSQPTPIGPLSVGAVATITGTWQALAAFQFPPRASQSAAWDPGSASAPAAQVPFAPSAQLAAVAQWQPVAVQQAPARIAALAGSVDQPPARVLTAPMPFGWDAPTTYVRPVAIASLIPAPLAPFLPRASQTTLRVALDAWIVPPPIITVRPRVTASGLAVPITSTIRATVVEITPAVTVRVIAPAVTVDPL